MRTETDYQIAKSTLKSIAIDAKAAHRKDKPMIRQIINDSADSIARDMRLTDWEAGLLDKYACSLHPK